MSITKIRAYGVGKMQFHNVTASDTYSYCWALGPGYREEKGVEEVGRCRFLGSAHSSFW